MSFGLGKARKASEAFRTFGSPLNRALMPRREGKVSERWISSGAVRLNQYGGWLQFTWSHPPDFMKGKQRVCTELCRFPNIRS